MATRESLQARLLELRQSFDRAFVEPAMEANAAATLDLLAIRVGRDPYGLRLSEIAALEADRTITAVPSEHPELLGIAGVRGGVVAVFDLASLLGAPRPDVLRWLVLVKGTPLALAFSGFDGQLSVPADALAAAEPGASGRVRQVARGRGSTLPVIDVPALIAPLDQRVPRRSPTEHGAG